MEARFINPWNYWTGGFVGLLVPLVLFLLMLKKCKKSEAAINMLPPGPKKLPIIGNLHLISFPVFRSLRALSQKYGPLMYLQLGEVHAIIISSAEVAKEMLSDMDPNFADRVEDAAMRVVTNNYIDIAFSQYGKYWRQMRKICIEELLRSQNVRSFASIRNDEVSRLVESIRLSTGKPVNMSEKISVMLRAITSRTAFGNACKDSDKFVALLKQLLGMAGGFAIGDLFPSSKIINTLTIWNKLRMLKMGRKFNAIFDDIINEHKRNLQDSGTIGVNANLVDALLRIKESGKLEIPIGDHNIKAVLLDVFAGGTETSSTTIDWAMAELMRNPGMMAKAQAEVRRVFKNNIGEHDIDELKYLKAVIKETLRLHPPGGILPRKSRDESKIRGYTIPGNMKILVNVWAIQREPKYWTDPDSFQPERFENAQSINFTGNDHFELMPFGGGRRICPGMTFGLANVEVPLAHLLYNFDWTLPDGLQPQDLDMSEMHGFAASRQHNLFLVPTAYQPLL